MQQPQRRNLDKFGLYQKVLNQSEIEKARHEESQIRTHKQIQRNLNKNMFKGQSGEQGMIHVFAICKNWLEEKHNEFTEIPKIKFHDSLKAKRVSIANNIKGDNQ